MLIGKRWSCAQLFPFSKAEQRYRFSMPVNGARPIRTKRRVYRAGVIYAKSVLFVR